MPAAPDSPPPILERAVELALADIDTFWQTRPRCPFHEHPLWAIDAEGEAIWRCSAGEWKWLIGSLANDAEYLTAIHS